MRIEYDKTTLCNLKDMLPEGRKPVRIFDTTAAVPAITAAENAYDGFSKEQGFITMIPFTSIMSATRQFSPQGRNTITSMVTRSIPAIPAVMRIFSFGDMLLLLFTRS